MVKEQIPENWCIKARNKKEEKLVNEYARIIGGGHWSDENNFAKTHYLYVNSYKYNSGRTGTGEGFEELSFEDFRRYVLNEPEKTLDLW